MSCSLCLSPGIGQCPETRKIFCSEKCQFVDWYLISAGGRKRERDAPKDLASRFSLSQLYQILTKKRNPELFDNNEFWYYSILKHEPQHLWYQDEYDPNSDYRDIAKRKIFNIIEEEEEVMDLREGTMDPVLRKVLTLVSESRGAILDIILKNFDIKDILSWSQVSYEFNRIVTKSQHFWYLFLRKYSKSFDEPFQPPKKNPNTGVILGTDYYQRAKDEFDNQFKKLFQVIIISENGNFGIDFNNPDMYQEYKNAWASKKFSVFDIMNYGGLRRLIEMLDDFNLYSESGDMLEDEIIYTGSVNNVYQDNSESIGAILRSYNRNFTEIIEQMQYEDRPITVKLLIERIEPSLFEINIVYPRELIQPFTKDMKQFRDEAFETKIDKPPTETLNYAFTYWENEDVQYFYEKLYELPIPPYFTLRGDYARPLDPAEWEVIVDGKYHLPDTYLDIERIVEILSENDPYWKSNGFDIEIKKK